MAPKGPKQRKLLKNKAVVVTSTVNDGTSGNGVKDNGQSTEKTSGGQKRRVAKKKQTSGGDKFDTLAIDTEVPKVKVARRTKQTKLSSAQSQETTGSNSARKKQLLKNGKSQRFKDSETESVHVEIKRCQRQSKTKAKSKITQHFEESCQTQLLSGSALKKAESNIWGEIAGKQRNELGRVGKKMGDSGTVGKWGENEGGVEEQEEEENETEEATSKTRARKQKGKGGEENKSASCPKAGVKQMKKVGMGENVQKDADYLIEDDKGTEMDVAVSVQETAKGNKYIGAHTSIAGGLCNAVHGAVAIGAKAFGMFLRNQRQWLSKPLKEKDISDFKMALKDFGFSPNMVVPHGSYLMNCGSPSDELLRKSQELLLDELQRCEQLGLVMFNFHPGSTCGEINCSESIQRIADSVNSVHEKTKYVITVLENMCCQGNTIGGRFTELRSIIDLVHDKSRIGVCIDTCHAFAAGYDLSTEEGYIEMMSDLENIIGLKYLKAVHLNDSKGKVGCHLDRHENIGRGHIGLNGFRLMVNDPRFDNIPLVLETPAFLDDSKEVRTLYSLIKV